MRKIITSIFILLLVFVEISNAQDSEHIQDIITKYKISFSGLEGKIETFNIYHQNIKKI